MAYTRHGAATAAAWTAYAATFTNVQVHYLSGYTPDPDDSFWSDISSFEAAGAPTETVTFTATYDSANNRVKFDITDITEDSITTDTDGFAVVFNSTVDSTSPIFYTGDMTQLQPTDGTLSLTFDADGLTAENMVAT